MGYLKKSTPVRGFAMTAVALLFVNAGVKADLAPIMWAHDSRANLYEVDCSTGQAELIGNTGVAFTDIAFAPDGRLLGVTYSQLYEIDREDATASLIGYVPGAGFMNALVFDTEGVLWGAGSGSVFRIDPETAQGENVATLSWGQSSAGDLALDREGNMYLTTTGGTVVSIDTTDGSVSEVCTLPYTNVYAFGRAPDDRMFGITSDNMVLEIDLHAGTSREIGRIAADFTLGNTYGGRFPTEAVPEPATVVLLGLGGFLLRPGRKVRR
jgi:outer membrane protein assembly factor BamB